MRANCIQIRTLVLLCLAGLITLDAFALNPTQGRRNLAPMTEFFADESRRLTYRQVQALPDDAWTVGNSTTFSFGFTTVPYWFRVPIHNDTNTAQHLLLEIAYAKFDNLEVFVEIDGNLKRYVSGVDHPYEMRVIKHRHHVFPIELEPRQVAHIVVRAQTSSAFVIPLRLWNAEAFAEADETETLMYGAYFGVWLLVLIFNTVLYTALRIPALISFVAFMFSFGVYQLADLGFGTGFYWTQSPGLYDSVIVLSIGIAIVSMMWLANNLLRLRETNPVGLRVLQFAAYPALICLIAYPLLGFESVIPVLTALAIPVAAIVIWLGFWHAWLGNRMALYSSIAWTILLLGVISHVLTRFQLLPLNFITEHMAPVGFVMMIVSLSFFGAAEIRRQQQGEPLTGLIRSAGNSRDLEDIVNSRTQELETALSELSQANATLREINTLDAVTGIRNRHFFDSAFALEWKRASREKYPISLMMFDLDYFKQVNDRFGHLAGDDCLRGVADTISAALRRPGDIVSRYGGEEFVAVLPYVENDNALKVADQIRQRIEATTYHCDGHDIRVTVSIGVCTVTPGERDDRKDMIGAADIALYEAKNNGRNRVCNAGQLTVHEGKAVS